MKAFLRPIPFYVYDLSIIFKHKVPNLKKSANFLLSAKVDTAALESSQDFILLRL